MHDDLRAPLQQALHGRLGPATRLPRMQRAVVLGRIACDDLGIEAIGLAARTQALGVEVDIAGVEHVDDAAALMRQARQQQVMLASGFHGDDRLGRHLAQPAGDRRCLVVHALVRGRAMAADHQRRLGHVHSDKHGIGLHRHLLKSDNRDAGVERPLPR